MMQINTMQYNTDKAPVILPEFGRNLQGMVEYCVLLPDREERTRCAYTIAGIMGDIFPELIGENNDYTQVWNQINIMSGFKLDIDFPCEVVTQENLHPKPAKIPYTASAMMYRHYGKNIEKMIRRVSSMEPSEERDALISMIAHHMKKLQLTHNKEGADDAKILRDLCDYSEGAINLDPATYLLHEFREAPQPKPNNKGKNRKGKQMK